MVAGLELVELVEASTTAELDLEENETSAAGVELVTTPRTQWDPNT